MPRRRFTIRGLVRLRERVRDQVSRGLTPVALLELRSEVEGAVETVERLCRDAGVAPARLPAPTRNAYRYLKAIPFDRLPAGERPLARSVRVRGVVEAYEQALAGLATAAPDFAAVRARAAAALATIERGAAERGLERRDLSSRSAAAWAAIADLVREGAGEELVVARERLERLAAPILRERRARAAAELPLRLTLRRSASLWRLRETRAAIELMIADAFAGAPDEVLLAVLRWALAGGGGRARSVAEDWLARRPGATPAPAAPGAARARGLHHDLDDIFEEVNREHFGGAVARPRLAWSAGPTYHRFGSYTYAEDRLVVSASLDRPDVPRFAVAHVVHHELLHKTLGLHPGRGERRRAHTAEFRRRERCFPRFAEASALLDRLARRGRRR